MIKSLYGYLKPGGQWIVYEHVITHVGGLVAWYQCRYALLANVSMLMLENRGDRFHLAAFPRRLLHYEGFREVVERNRNLE